MSRKFRAEKQKILALNAEVQEELDRVKLQKERIYAPIIWTVLPHLGIRIEDVKEPLFDEVLDLLGNNLFDQDVLCRNAGIANDPESIESFRQRIIYELKFRQSIAARNLETGEVAAVLVLKAEPKSDCGRVFERTLITKGEAFQKIIKFRSYVTRKTDVYGMFNVNTYLEYVLLCVKENYKHRGIGDQLMLCGLDVARAQNCPVVSGIFQSYKTQKMAKSIGMKTLYKLSYLDWKDEDGELIIPEPGAGNYHCAVMGGEVPPPPEPPATEPSKEKDLNLRLMIDEIGKNKMTRAQKLEQLAKEKTEERRTKRVSIIS